MIVPPKGNVQWDTDTLEWIIRGKRTPQLIGRSSFKSAILLSYHYSGQGGQVKPEGARGRFFDWIIHNQDVFNRTDVVLRVFLETGDWSHCAKDACMFGSPPQDQRVKPNGQIAGMWNLQELKQGGRLKDISALMRKTLDEMFRASHETGCIWELVVDATIKHTDGAETGDTDHAIRQVAEECRLLQKKYPNAAVILSARNEWDAHNGTHTTLDEVNMWATRFCRWARPHPTKPAPAKETKVSYARPPGNGWQAEQWPEGFIIVDHGGYDMFDYACGPEPGKFKMGAVHIGRKGHDQGEPWNPRDWKEIPPAMFEWLWRNARGMPVGSPESMYALSKEGTEPWYRNPSGWNQVKGPQGISDQLAFYANCIISPNPRRRFAYFIVHDDIGAQSDHTWNPNSAWERELTKLFATGVPPDPPTPPPTPVPEPPPPPDPPTDSVKVVSGSNFRSLQFADFPRVVDATNDSKPWAHSYRVELPKTFDITAVDFFFGHDKGDSFEMDATVFADIDPSREHMRWFVARRIEEKVAPGGEANLRVVLEQPISARVLKIDVLLRVTGANDTIHSDHDSYRKWRGNFDLNIMLVGA